MKTFFIKFVLTLSIFFTPMITSAAGFGGYVTFTIPCTCSGGLMAFFSPLYLSSKVPVFGNMYISPETRVYRQFLRGVPTTWELGTYTPGGACTIVAPNPVDPCVPIPTLGTIKFMGTSFTGARP